MAHKLNPYMNFTGGNGDNSNELSLIDGLVAETIQHNGTLINYIPRTFNKLDHLFGEDVLSSFDFIMPIEGLIETVDSFEGDSEIVAAFDIVIKDTVKVRFSTSRFAEEALSAAIKSRPVEGDLIHIPMVKSLFEIKFVEDEDQFYAAGGLSSFLVTAEKFDYSMEGFSTGDIDIDSINDLVPSPSIAEDFGDNLVLETEAAETTAFNTSNPFGEY